MNMIPADITTYPKFYDYVKHQMPKVAYVNSIINAIKRFSGATTKATIKRGLLWGQNPSIHILPNLVCGGVNSYGCYPVWGGHKIQIDQALVQAFEAGTDKRATRSGQMVNVTGVTLLHELTHWADAQDGVDNPVPGDPTNEEGNAFELAVYGKIMVL